VPKINRNIRFEEKQDFSPESGENDKIVIIIYPRNTPPHISKRLKTPTPNFPKSRGEFLKPNYTFDLTNHILSWVV
jgi:hypothetical protein